MNFGTEMVREIMHNDKEVLIVDYSNCTGSQMIDVFEKAHALVLNKNSPVVILSIFNARTFVSPSFIQHAEKVLPEVEHLIRRQAIIGLSSIQEWILKGVNLWYKRTIYHFSTEAEALDFLTSNTAILK